MTLIVSAGEESLSCKSDDEDKSGLPRSLDHTQEDDIGLMNKDDDVISQTSLKHCPDCDENTVSEKNSEVILSELNISLKNDDNEASPSVVMYKCSVSVESIPKSISNCEEEANTHVSCKKDQINTDSVLDDYEMEGTLTDPDNLKEEESHSDRLSKNLGTVEESCQVSSFLVKKMDFLKENYETLDEDIVQRQNTLSSPTSSLRYFDPLSSGVSNDDAVDSEPGLIEASNSKCKTKLKKLMQRRTVSESNSLEVETSTKKSLETLRHSFSASDYCDNVQIDLDFILNKCKLDVKDISLNSDKVQNMGTLGPLTGSNSIDIPVFKSSRKSAEITDTLVYSVKKSMIEEYQNLKKKNSSLVNDSNYSSPENNVSILSKYKSSQIRTTSVVPDVSVGCPKKVIENCEYVHPTERAFPDGEHLCSNLDVQNSKLRDGIPVTTNLNSEMVLQPAMNGYLGQTDNDSHEGKSSPPSRLETWKNLLAEKRNSLKGNIRAINKCDEFHQEVVDITEDYSYAEINENYIILQSSFPSQEKVVSSTVASFPVDDGNTKVYCNLNNISNDHRSLDFAVAKRTVHKDISEGLYDENFLEYSPAICESLKQKNLNNCNSESCEGYCNNFAKCKIKGACQDIAKALYSIPVVSDCDMLNNNGLMNNPFVNNVQQIKSVVQVCPSVSMNSEQNKSLNSSMDSSTKENPNQHSTKSGVESNLSTIITNIKPPILIELLCSEKSQQCPTPPPETVSCEEDSAEDNKEKSSAFTSSEDDSDYCQTDECGDDCDYCSGEDAEDEEDDTCNLCRQNRSLSPVCKHTRVITNGSLRRQQMHDDKGTPPRLTGSRSLVIQAALRRRKLNTQELCAIREYSITSDEQLDSDEEQSQDDNMCDLSSSWRFGLCREPVTSKEATLRSNHSVVSLPSVDEKRQALIKSNSLPVNSLRNSLKKERSKRPGSAVIKSISNSDDEGIFVSGVNLPRRPPRAPKSRIHSCNPLFSKALPMSLNKNPRPTMGLQCLQQRPSTTRLTQTGGYPTGPKTLAPRSPLNPNPPFGFPSPPSLPVSCSGSSPLLGRKSHTMEGIAPPGSPRTCSRSGALVTRNFSISDDEGGQRLSRRQVTITRHESACKEAADKGYHIAPCSPVDPYWLTWKLGVLQKTLEDVCSRLEESEKVVATWGPIPLDSNLADQHVHNVRKFRENTADLQRGVDDVNDQAARFSAHNIPLTPQNCAALHDLNNRWKNLETTVNDRWRQVAGRSREVTPLTPAQLASSVNPPWERATATNKVPYYINHSQETTHWDHPIMMDLLDSLADFNHIKFSAYRTASKLRSLQKKLSLDRAKLQLVTDVFDEHGLRGQNDRLIDVNDMIVVLSTLYGRISSDHVDVNTTIATDLCLNWLLNVYDSQRTGQMRVLSFRIGLICLCRGHLEEKYRYMFRLIADPNRLVDQRKLGLLLHDCVQVPRQLGEVAAFGGSNIEPSVRSCFTKAGKDRETIEAVHFLTWVQQEPQSLVWLAVLHRVAASETVQHQVKCNICKTYPITGLRYRCLKCLSFDMCQRCFFDGRSSKSHKITHPMHEYCTATTAGDEMKDFTKALKNKFKSKRSLQKHTKKGYLPVQTVLEGDPLESPSPSPSHNVSSQDMHSRLELYASRLAEVELRTNSNSTPDSEDEHGLIAQYCQSLSSSDAPFPVPKSPLQIMASVDADQKDELEQMIRDLEEENQALQAEYERLKSQQPTGSALDDGMGQRSETEMLAEAKLLREHKGRLEARMSILEDHNRQLEAQLQRLRQLLVEQQGGMGSPNKSGTLQTKSVTASQLAMDSPAKINGHSSQGDLEKAVGNLVDSMNPERANDSHSDDNSDENDYDNTGINQASSIN